MRYHNGHLRNEQDLTLTLRLYEQRESVDWKEYAPFAAIARLMLSLLLPGMS